MFESILDLKVRVEVLQAVIEISGLRQRSFSKLTEVLVEWLDCGSSRLRQIESNEEVSLSYCASSGF